MALIQIQSAGVSEALSNTGPGLRDVEPCPPTPLGFLLAYHLPFACCSFPLLWLGAGMDLAHHPRQTAGPEEQSGPPRPAPPTAGPAPQRNQTSADTIPPAPAEESWVS